MRVSIIVALVMLFAGTARADVIGGTCPPGEVYETFPVPPGAMHHGGGHCVPIRTRPFHRPWPTDCLEPGGVTVCGCDRNEYIGECSAYLAGVDVARIGPCVTTSAYRTAMAERDCAPTDGPAWTFTLTTSRTSCDEVRTDGSISISVWHALDTAAPETTYTLGTDFASDGHASICGAPGTPCAVATGTIVVHVFASGEVARFDYDLRTEDGRRFAETDIEVASFWCRVAPVGCG